MVLLARHSWVAWPSPPAAVDTFVPALGSAGITVSREKGVLEKSAALTTSGLALRRPRVCDRAPDRSRRRRAAGMAHHRACRA
jgi:hypothetical protein